MKVKELKNLLDKLDSEESILVLTTEMDNYIKIDTEFYVPILEVD